MSEPYTPTTADMRHGYIVTSMRYTPETDEHLLGKRRWVFGEEFDRWLDRVRAAAHREGQAEAWDEGAEAGAEHVTSGHPGDLSNPYEEDRHVDQ